MSDIPSFGAWLKRRRKALDLTQDALAQLVGCSVVSIRKLEGDAQRPSRQLAELLAQHLQVAPEQRATFIQFARLGLDGAPPDLPLPDEAQIPSAAAPRLPPMPPHNLPIPPTPLFGRADALASLDALLRRPAACLVTLTGVGGSGKTRLALQAAAELRDVFVDSIWFVDLAPISDPALVIPTIMQTLGLKEQSGLAPLAQLSAYLRAKQLLLVLDNFEHVVDAARYLAELLARAPQLKLLVTSRVMLHIRGEHEFQVPPLALPDLQQLPPLASIVQYAAIALFVARVQDVQPAFELTTANARAVAAICVRLDGLPLAIELAAARVKLFPPQVLLTRLEQRLGLLTHGPRDAPARQRTLRNTIDWSYDLLTTAEQTLFRRLAAFAGGWTLEAAAEVCDVDSDLGVDALDGLQSLVDQSLVRYIEGPDGAPRFTMLETIHEYANERLAASGEVEALRRQHAGYYLRLAEAAEPQLLGAEQRVWLRRLEAEYNNLRTALGWSLSAQGDAELALRFAAALGFFCILHGSEIEGRAWLEGALEWSRSAIPPPPAAVRAKALFARGSQMQHIHGHGRAMPLLEESLALYQELRDRDSTGMVLLSMGRLARDQGELAHAQTLLEESLELCREQGNAWGISMALLSLGNVALDQGDYARATTRFQAALALSREVGDQNTSAWSLFNLGLAVAQQEELARALAICGEALAQFHDLGIQPGVAQARLGLGQVALAQGDLAQARTSFAESLALCWEQGNLRDVAYGFAGLAAVAGAQQRPERAARLFGAAEALRESISHPLPPVNRAAYERAVAVARAQMDEDAFAAAWAAGRVLSLDQAVAETLDIPA